MSDEKKLDLIGYGIYMGSRWSKQNTIDELEKIKTEIDTMLKSDEVKNDKWANVIINKSYLFKRIINKHIAELKGENNGKN